MADQRERVRVLYRGVDDANQMLLIGGQGQLQPAASSTSRVDILAVEKEVVAVWRGARKAGDIGVVGVVHAKCNLVDGSEIPISNHQGSQVYIIVGTGWAANVNWTQYSVSVLCREVRMVPVLGIIYQCWSSS